MSYLNIAPKWQVRLKDQLGYLTAVFDSFLSIRIEKNLNDVGSFTISFADNGDERLGLDYWQLDAQIELLRSLPYYVDNLGTHLVPWYIEFEGLLRSRAESISESGEKVITFSGTSYEGLLARRVIAALEGTIRSDKDNYADSVMAEYVIENCGNNATADRGRYFYSDYSDPNATPIPADGVMSNFYVAAATNSGARWVGRKSMENLLDALKDIASSTGVDFAVIGVQSIDSTEGPVGFEFRTYINGRGKDRSAEHIDVAIGVNTEGESPVIFSLQTDNVANMEHEIDRSKEATMVYVLGKGDASTRSVLPWMNEIDRGASPWNQIEVARAASDQDFVYQLRQFALQTLEETHYDETFKFKPRQTPQSVYGYHYYFGDKVTVKYGESYGHLNIIKVQLDVESSGEETIVLELGKKTWGVSGAIQPDQLQPAIAENVDIPLLTDRLLMADGSYVLTTDGFYIELA